MRAHCAILVLLVATSAGSAQTLAFTGADGYGQHASGGRGGEVLQVTNLEDSGPGSLRFAVERKGARTVVFRVSGNISLKSDLLIKNGDLTIAGQTAPGDGICIKDYPTIVEANNVIIRYLRFRLGDKTRQAADALTAMKCRNVIIDHCSMSWGIDEVGSFYDNQDFTLQWCLLSESLDKSSHPKGPHGYGGIWGGTRASFHHNLLAHHSSRNPRFQGGRTPGIGKTELADFRNNVVYNWGFKCAYGGEKGRQNVVANYFKPGPASLRPERFLEPDDSEGKWYVAENVVEGSPEVTADNWQGGVAGQPRETIQAKDPFPSVAMVTEDAREAYKNVLRLAGALLPVRDSVDLRILREVEQGVATYGSPSYAVEYRIRKSMPLGIIDSQDVVGGWPVLRSNPAAVDSDGDGIPDDWELKNGLDPKLTDDGRKTTKSGYTNLELYLNQIGGQ